MNILIFGPNGSGKGTQSRALMEKFGLEHIESGGIFREQIKNKTDLGKKAIEFIDLGELVPDSITIPMVLDRLRSVSSSGKRWILDGFPRNPSQSRALFYGLMEADLPLGAVITIDLSRETSKARLMGRRTCREGHPNNTAIEPIAPVNKEGKLVCWKCGTEVSVRSDDIDEHAIDVRLDIYFDEENGTLGGIKALEELAKESEEILFIHVDGASDIKTVTNNINSAMG